MDDPSMRSVSNVFRRVLRRLRYVGAPGYEAAKLKEIAQFKDIKNIHELPEIFHYWSHTYVRPHLVAAGFESIDDFYAKSLMRGVGANPRFLSVGAGYCDTEIRVAKLMKQAGLAAFTFECLELNPHLLERGRELARSEGMSEHMVFTEADFNRWRPDTTYAGVMANHSLHHVVDLEGLFDAIGRALAPHGRFVTADMIGRNGHQRWPEALEIVNRFWEELPDAYRFNHQMDRMERTFVNWDCSVSGFEGIRAQDILQLLLERFHFEYFHGFANVVAPFIDRGFGHNFDAKAEWDRSFVDRLHAIDEEGFQSGRLKPTQMFAVMTKDPVAAPVFTRGLSPDRAVRPTSAAQPA
jgi:SAM-dependent methyltransferase